MKKTIPIDQIVFRKDIYPRLETSTTTVQKYAEDTSVLPEVEVNQHNELIDGWHRWTARKKVGEQTIDVIVTTTASDAELLELSIQRNASHGLQLSQEDKRDLARKIYHSTAERDRDAKKKQLSKLLSVSDRTIRDWLSRIDKDTKEARDKRIFEMWLACYTQEEIAEECGCERSSVDHALRGTADLPDGAKPVATHAVDFDPPLYNIWKQQEKTAGSNHFGNSEVRWVDNLLYLSVSTCCLSAATDQPTARASNGTGSLSLLSS